MNNPSTNQVMEVKRPSLAARFGQTTAQTRGLVWAFLGYWVISLAIWQNLWTHNPRSTTVDLGRMTDAPTFIWFLEWPVHAFTSGLNPWFSTAMFPPGGINLLANTGVLLLGTLLSPITYLFGPVLSMNIALMLSPTLSALAMFVLIRRWVRWQPAAFVGGFMYGFCSFILFSLLNGQLHQGMSVFPPLIVALLDSILIRQKKNPYVLGLWLTLAVVGQFFIGTELLLMLAIFCALCLAGLVAYALPAGLLTPARIRYSLRALTTTGLLASVMLIFPSWFALAGPAHFKGPVWSSLPALCHSTMEGVFFNSSAGLQGSWNQTYCGFGLGLVAVLGLLVYRQSRHLWFFGFSTMVAIVLSLGISFKFAPWRLVAGVKVFESVVPMRFIFFAILSMSVMVAIVIDRIYSDGAGRRVAPLRQGSAPALARIRRGVPALMVSALVVLPFAIPVGRQLPMPTSHIQQPRWFVETAPKLPAGQTYLTVPFPAFYQNAAIWQALGHMHWTIASGFGPGADNGRNPYDVRSMAVLRNMSFINTPTAPSDALEIRNSMGRWGVDRIVLNARAHPMRPSSIALFTSATGTAPTFSQGVWLWPGIHDMKPMIELTSAQYEQCIQVPSHAVVDVAACVMSFTR
jgi:hypothetical protein